MGLAQAWSVALLGVDGVPVEIEAHVGIGLPGFALVGLPDAALHESKERVRAAVLNSGEHWPNRRTTLALSPATLRKVGSSYDLALACAVLAADKAVPLSGLLGSTVLLGELALDGRLRPVRGVLPSLLAARRAGLARAVALAALPDAALVPDIEVFGAGRLRDVLAKGDQAPNGPDSGNRRSGLSSSSTLTSLKVITRALLRKRAGRYMSHTHASDIRTSK